MDHPRATIGTWLCTNGFIATFDETAHVLLDSSRLAAVCVTIDHRSLANASAKQLIDWHSRFFAFDVPQRQVNRPKRRFEDWAISPIAPVVQQLPDVSDPIFVMAENQFTDMPDHLGNHLLTSIHGSVTYAVNTLIGHHLDEGVISARTGHNHFNFGNRHTVLPWLNRKLNNSDQLA